MVSKLWCTEYGVELWQMFQDSQRLMESQQQQHTDDYYHNFPDIVQSDELLVAQEDIDSIRSALLELKKERKVS